MTEIVQLFFQECREALDVMETGLLSLNTGTDRESINAIFRAAHSIKGGAATFGFSDIAAFTHGVETLLDDMRDGKRSVATHIVQALLQSCDCLRDMVAATEAGTAIDDARVAALTAQVSQLLDAVELPKSPHTPSVPDDSPDQAWLIIFDPVADLLKVRNEPTRMFAELAALGELKAEACIDRLPPLAEMDPEACYLSWRLELRGDVSKQAIEEIFDWVDPACQLAITALSPEVPAVQAEPAAEKSAVPSTRSATRGAAPRAPDAGSIRVATDKIDSIMNLVGELVITQSMLGTFAEDSASQGLRQGLLQLARNTRELQQSVMQIRMLPIGHAFNRLPRMVHDLSAKLGKQVELHLLGESTELDKTVLEKITDPLVHLIRNALDHGLETSEVRRAAGKPESGTVQLAAFHEGGNIIIEVRDDGAGLNKSRILQKALAKGLVKKDQDMSDDQIHNLIFLPGFSTAEQVSDVSGRGVGMDVVRRNINDLGGHVQISSTEGKGSVIRIRLPLTLAILDGQLVRVGGEIYVISLLSIVETIQISRERLKTVGVKSEVFKLRDEYLPVVKLCDLFGAEPDSRRTEDGLLVVVEADGTRVGLLVDDLLAQQQVVVKSLETNFRPVDGVMGATILGDGSVALIIDVPGLITLATTISRASAGIRAA